MAYSRVRAAVALAGAVFMLAACDHPVVQERPPAPGDTAVARVAGRTVWASDVKRAAVAQGVIGEGEPLDPSSDLFRRVLDEVIDEKLLAREALKRQLDKKPVAQRRLAAARERILGDMLVESAVDSNINDASVQELYDDQLRLAKRSDQFHARMIQVKTKAEADGLMKQLSAGGSFEALAMDHSTDPQTRLHGGDLGYFTPDEMPAFAGVLQTAKAGETLGPVQTDQGFAILRIEDRRQEQAPTIEQARPEIIHFLQYEGVLKLLKDLRRDAKVEVLIKGDPLKVPGAPQEPASAPLQIETKPPAPPAPFPHAAAPPRPRPAQSTGAPSSDKPAVPTAGE